MKIEEKFCFFTTKKWYKNFKKKKFTIFCFTNKKLKKIQMNGVLQKKKEKKFR